MKNCNTEPTAHHFLKNDSAGISIETSKGAKLGGAGARCIEAGVEYTQAAGYDLESRLYRGDDFVGAPAVGCEGRETAAVVGVFGVSRWGV